MHDTYTRKRFERRVTWRSYQPDIAHILLLEIPGLFHFSFPGRGHLDNLEFSHLYIFREFPTRKSVLIGVRHAHVPLHHDRYDGSRLFQKMSWGLDFFSPFCRWLVFLWNELDLALYIQTVCEEMKKKNSKYIISTEESKQFRISKLNRNIPIVCRHRKPVHQIILRTKIPWHHDSGESNQGRDSSAWAVMRRWSHDPHGARLGILGLGLLLYLEVWRWETWSGYQLPPSYLPRYVGVLTDGL
jgi:hypothetical protein